MVISIIRTVILYIIVALALRLMGKRQLGELQTSELVVTLLVSNIATIPMQNTNITLLSGLIPIAVLISFEIILSLIMLKSAKFRKFVCGSPAILINNGTINQKEMGKLRISIEDLEEQLRQLEVGSISDVNYAIVETSGKLSVIKKPERQQPDASMFNMPVENNGIELVIVRDSTVIKESMKVCKLSEEWLNNILKKENVTLNDIFIMTSNTSKSFNIIKKERV
jgi:uncharacterized membrane protein YcaP (DUF421 family)